MVFFAVVFVPATLVLAILIGRVLIILTDAACHDRHHSMDAAGAETEQVVGIRGGMGRGKRRASVASRSGRPSLSKGVSSSTPRPGPKKRTWSVPLAP